MNTDLIYQKIGEFVVSFQWFEHRLREIGWVINDPERKIWPPKDFREESNAQIISKVESVYINFIKNSILTDKEKKIKDFKNLVLNLNDYRRYRNRLLHSAFTEVKGGGEILEIWSTNPKLKYEKGKPIFDTIILTPEKIDEVMLKMANDAFKLNIFYMQAIHLSGC
ncbi:hypothetical protein N9R54_00330 [Pelobium sp.]|nr:hypothetical protein [Pelobium sp.]MDA9554654.1 hypothetical protein [Pelobium sp.]